MSYKINLLNKTKFLLLFFATMSILAGCVGDELFRDTLPDSNSKVDTVFPGANFSYASSSEDFRIVNFSNLSSEATNFIWDFGDGNTSTEKDPSFTFQAGEGTYPVTLTATDGNGVTGTTSIDVLVVEGPFQPIILEPGFEDLSLPDGTGDGRDSWRADWSDERAIFGISGSPVTFGDQAAKLEVSSARQGYQEIVVVADTNYDLTFWYTMTDSSADPYAIVAIVGVTEFGPIGSIAEAEAGIIASKTISDTDDPATYVQEKLSFNSGNNNVIAIYFYNDANVETRLDDFAIEIGVEGALPPSAGFSTMQSTEDYLEYAFTNSSSDATTYLWDFGDGNTSTEESPIHVYETPNVYIVNMTATNDFNLSTSLSRTIDIQAPVTAGFTFEVDATDYKTYIFTDTSIDAVTLLWEFGDGFQFTGMNPSHTYEEDGTYDVTLTATSVTGNTDVVSEQLIISEGFVVKVLNGDFSDGTSSWKPSSFAGSNSNAFNTSSDGDTLDYSGVDTGVNTPGAKYTGTSSMVGPLGSLSRTSDSRAAYQEITVEANKQYVIEFNAAITNSGDAVYVEILDGWFNGDGEAAFTSSTVDGPLARAVVDVANGKANFTVGSDTFTANTSGEVTIWMYSLTTADAWVDNIKVTEVE